MLKVGPHKDVKSFRKEVFVHMLKSTLRVRFTRLVGALLLAAAAVGMLAVAGACGGSGGSDGDSPTPTFTRDVEDQSRNLKPAPNFTINVYQGSEVLGGDTLELSDLQGKPLAINFWGGLCPPCRAELPDFQAFYDTHKDQINMFGLDVGALFGLGARDDGRDLLEELGITFPAGYTDDEDVIKNYRVLGIPATAFITAEGEIFRFWQGPLTEEKLAEITEEMLATTGS